MGDKQQYEYDVLIIFLLLLLVTCDLVGGCKEGLGFFTPLLFLAKNPAVCYLRLRPSGRLGWVEQEQSSQGT